MRAHAKAKRALDRAAEALGEAERAYKAAQDAEIAARYHMQDWQSIDPACADANFIEGKRKRPQSLMSAIQ